MGLFMKLVTAMGYDLKAWEFIDRFDKASRIGKWTTDERKIDEFTSLLRDDANEW